MYLAAWDNGRTRTEAAANTRIARAWCEQRNEQFWLDLEAPSADDLKFLGTQFGFHPLALEECDHTGVRPKIEEFDGYLYLVLHGINHNEGQEELDTVEFKIFLSRGRLVTIHSHPSSSVRKTQERLARDAQFMSRGVDNVFHSIVDAMIDHYFPVLEDLEDRLQAIEAVIFKDPSQSLLEAILDLRRESWTLQRLIQPQLDILGALSSGTRAEIDPQDAAYFRDVYDHLLRISDRVHGLRDGLQTAMECHLSATSNRMNAVMKTLTLVSAMILPASLLVSLLGMSFDYLPGRMQALGWVSALCLVVMAAIYVVLRRIRWL
jgi:magnesium transporter